MIIKARRLQADMNKMRLNPISLRTAKALFLSLYIYIKLSGLSTNVGGRKSAKHITLITKSTGYIKKHFLTKTGLW